MRWKIGSAVIVTVLIIIVGVVGVEAQREARPAPSPALASVGTGFTYQGYIEDLGSPANGAYDFEFKLYNDVSAGKQVGGTVTKGDVAVVDGLFTVELDFGSVFDGTALWLEVWVRPGASTGSYQQLLPRQALTAVPYASYARGSAWSGLSGVPAGFADGADNNTTYSAGNGLILGAGQFSVDYAGSGGAATAARSDHDHWSQTWTGSGTGLTLSGGSIGLNASGGTYGVRGQSASTSNGGVYGLATATSGGTYGVRGQSASTSGLGVLGGATATSGATSGVRGESASIGGTGVFGYATATSGSTYGVWGRSDSTSGRGVYGYAWATSGTTYGVFGRSSSSSGYDFYAAGPGTDYGPFTGAHEVKLSASFPSEVKAGMIVSATGEAQIRPTADGSVDISSTLPTVRLADTDEDKAVFGVLVAEVTLPEDHWYPAGEDERFASANALGEGRVWVSNFNGDIEAGDYINTSILPGYGQRQNDDLLHSYTLGKTTETVDWDTVTETVVHNGQGYKVYLIAVVYTSG